MSRKFHLHADLAEFKLADVSCLAYNMGEALPRAAVFTDSADFGRFCQILPDLRAFGWKK